MSGRTHQRGRVGTPRSKSLVRQTGSSDTSSGKAGPGRPQVISSEALLEVARAVFLERGVRATTAEVAERAGVSEGTVFHRFKSKEMLFRRAMQFNPDEMPHLMAQTLDGVDALGIREALMKVATGILDLGRVAMPLLMMTWSNPVHCGLPHEKNREGYREMLKRFTAFFERKMCEGELRRMDPEVFTRVFIGSLHHFCLTQLTKEHPAGVSIPEGTFVREVVDLLLVGASPRPQELGA